MGIILLECQLIFNSIVVMLCLKSGGEKKYGGFSFIRRLSQVDDVSNVFVDGSLKGDKKDLGEIEIGVVFLQVIGILVVVYYWSIFFFLGEGEVVIEMVDIVDEIGYWENILVGFVLGVNLRL